jgi:hypothetical protein
VTGRLDTTLSVGSIWRMQGRNPNLIAIANGGTARSPNGDDGISITKRETSSRWRSMPRRTS